jgi:hypothetical protein
MQSELLEPEAIREMMFFKAMDLGIEQDVVEQLDAALCALLGMADPEPITDYF